MATPKKASAKPVPAKKPNRVIDTPPRTRAEHSAGFEAILHEYSAGVDLVRRREFAAALVHLRAVEKGAAEEPEMAERARTYIRLCNRRLTAPTPVPQDAEGRYLLGVFKSNQGKVEEAITLLDGALALEPGSARILYARSAARGLQGNTAAAIADLRQAVALDPKLRHQASNDPDFDKVRDEAAFIDVIEPTPAGA